MRMFRAFSSLAAVLIAFAPFHALAQTGDDRDVSVRDRARPDYDPLGLRFGGFTLNAEAALSVDFSDNVLVVETNEESDTIYALEPTATLSSNWGRHELVFTGGGRVENHADFSNEDVNTYFARASGRLDVGSRTNIRGSLGAAHEEESRALSDTAVGAAPVEYDRTDAALSVAHQFNRVTLTGSLGARDLDYDGVQNFRDNTSSNIGGRADIEINPRFGAVLSARADQREYDNSPALDSDGHTILAGVSFGLTNLLRGEVTAGQFSRDYDSGASTEGTAIEADLQWFITGLTTLSFNARQNAEDAIGAVGQPYIDRTYGGRVDHELLRNVLLTAGGQFGKREYETIDREDDYLVADAGVDYLLNRRVVVRGRYAFDRLESGGAARFRDYEVNTVTLGVGLRL